MFVPFSFLVNQEKLLSVDASCCTRVFYLRALSYWEFYWSYLGDSGGESNI